MASSALLPVTTGLPLRSAALDQLVGRVEPADQLDDDVDVVPGHQCGGVGADERPVDGRRAGLVRVGHGDPDQLQADPGAGGDVVGAGEQDLGQRAAHVAAAEQRRRAPSAPGARAGAALAASAVTSRRVQACAGLRPAVTSER